MLSSTCCKVEHVCGGEHHASACRAPGCIRVQQNVSSPQTSCVFHWHSSPPSTIVLNNRTPHICMQPGKAVFSQRTSTHMGPHNVQQATFCPTVSSQWDSCALIHACHTSCCMQSVVSVSETECQHEAALMLDHDHMFVLSAAAGPNLHCFVDTVHR